MTKEEIIDLVAKNRVWVLKNSWGTARLATEIALEADYCMKFNDISYSAENLHEYFTYSLDLKIWHNFEK